MLLRNKTIYCFQSFFLSFYLKNKKTNISKMKIFNIFYFYIRRKSLLHFFYDINFLFYNKFFVSNFLIRLSLDMKESLNLYLIYDRSLMFFHSSLNFIMFQTKNLFFSSKNMINIFYSLKNMIKYNYYVFNYNFFLKYNKINKAKLRNIHQKRIENRGVLLGYKMAFYGRFTRKQRAASVWFKVGKVPLNSVTCRIDYGFYTIPLKNSAVSIKI